MPERSGHCIQGMRLLMIHCLPHRARRRSRVSICKSGNLLGMWEALPVERNTPNWHVGQSFQTWVVEMELRKRNVVSRAMNIHNIPPWVQVFGVAAPEISEPRTERHSAGDLYDYIHSFWLYSAIQSGAVFFMFMIGYRDWKIKSLCIKRIKNKQKIIH